MSILIHQTENEKLFLKRINGIDTQENTAAIEPQTPIYNPYGRNLLCFNQQFLTNAPCRYSYIVKGSTPETDFIHTSNEFAVNPIVPVLGLYATKDTTIEIILTNEHNDSYEYELISSYWQSIDFGNNILKIDFSVTDEDMAQSTIYNGWFINNWYAAAYDQNGDIRIAGLITYHPCPSLPCKMHNGYLYVPDVLLHEDEYFTKKILKLNFMGKSFGSFDIPEGLGMHHDVTWDNDGYMYCLASISAADNVSTTNRLEAILLKYIDETGELVNSVNYSEYFIGASALAFAAANDIHFNSIDYSSEIDQLILSSRSSSAFFGIDKLSLLPIWEFENPAHDRVLPDTSNLTVVNSADFKYPSGQHAVFVTHLQKYADYFGYGRIVLSLFNNVSCADADGNELFADSSTVGYDQEGFPWDSEVYVLGIDLNQRTAELLDRFVIENSRNVVTSGVFDTDDKKYFQIYCGPAAQYYVLDPTDGKIGIQVHNLKPDIDENIAANTQYLLYRGKVILFDNIRECL